MPSCCLIELEVVDETIDLVVSDPDSLTIEDGEYIPYRTSGFDHYEGPYEVVPTMSDQTLATTDKVMDDDVTVRAVPVYEVSNPYGTTVYIATLEG